MRNLVTLALAALVTFSACKKTEQQPKEMLDISTLPEFSLPVKNARWKIHMQGLRRAYDIYGLRLDNQPDKNIFMGVDTSIHTYITIVATGKDTLVNGKVYYNYILQTWAECTSCNNPGKPATSGFYLREDPVTKNIVQPVGDTEHVVIDFSDNINTGMVQPFYSWPAMQILSPSYLQLGHYKTKVWNMQNPNDKQEYFYCAEGIGGILGVLGNGFYIEDYFHMRSLDFVCDEDSLHFEYPLN